MANDRWLPIDLKAPMFTNIDEANLRGGAAVMENAFINEAGGHTRFFGYDQFSQLPDGKVYLDEWKDDLIAVTSTGRVYRVDQNGVGTDSTGVSPSGGMRAIFAPTEDQLIIATGGDLVQLAGQKTEILSHDAPKSTHVAYVDSFVLALEKDSGRFQHCVVGDYRNWDPLDTFSADGRPDNLIALKVTEFREVICAGKDSIEQFEPFPGGDRPFARRWSLGEGVHAPYVLSAADNGVWGITRLLEFVRYSGQLSQPEDAAVNLTLQTVDDWSEAWSEVVNIFGQKFIFVVIPNATNVYGTKGFTLLFDYKKNRWTFLFGWRDDLGLPQAWPVWSFKSKWGRHFLGGQNGEIYELKRTRFSNAGRIQRMYYRSAHIDKFGRFRVDGVRIRLKRGLGSNTAESSIVMRVRRNNEKWTRYQKKGLGRAGQRDMTIEFGGQGIADAFQFEYFVTDDVQVEVTAMQIRGEKIG